MLLKRERFVLWEQITSWNFYSEFFERDFGFYRKYLKLSGAWKKGAFKKLSLYINTISIIFLILLTKLTWISGFFGKPILQGILVQGIFFEGIFSNRYPSLLLWSIWSSFYSCNDVWFRGGQSAACRLHKASAPQSWIEIRWFSDILGFLPQNLTKNLAVFNRPRG
jgi:hypothetical protein